MSRRKAGGAPRTELGSTPPLDEADDVCADGTGDPLGRAFVTDGSMDGSRLKVPGGVGRSPVGAFRGFGMGERSIGCVGGARGTASGVMRLGSNAGVLSRGARWAITRSFGYDGVMCDLPLF